MSSLVVKLIALIAMTIDHTGFLVHNDVFRFVGRIAFPLYGFILVEGFSHTKNNKKKLFKYFLLLLIFAILSEVPYDLFFSNSYFDIRSQNVLFTLLSAFICMLIYEKNSSNILMKMVSILIVLYIASFAEILSFDYGILGVILIFCFYLICKYNTRYKNIMYFLSFALYIALSLLNGYNVLIFGVLLSLIPIFLYNGKKGFNSKIIKYMFYLYYPLHLLILYFIKIL